MNEQVANPGLLRPPLVYAGFGLAAVALHRFWPWSIAAGWIGRAVGIVLVVFSAALILWTLRVFASHQTPFPGSRAVRSIVVSGPFRFSRNPAYLGFSGIVLGAALLFDTYWMLPALVCSVAVVDRIVIAREERYLLEHFGERYREYRQRVRRWI